MDHSKHVRLACNELNQDVLKDAAIYGVDNEKVGTVSPLHGVGPESRVIIDVGGFLGIGAKPVAITIASLDFMRDVHAVTMWTKDQLKEMPEHFD